MGDPHPDAFVELWDRGEDLQALIPEAHRAGGWGQSVGHVDSLGACLSARPLPGSNTERNLSPPNSTWQDASENQCGCPQNGPRTSTLLSTS
jgi:hypothetical protein